MPIAMRSQRWRRPEALILTSFFLSVANTLGSAGKLPALGTAVDHSTAYWPMLGYTAGVVAGCFLAVCLEDVSAKSKHGLFLSGPAASAIVALSCIGQSTLSQAILNFLLGALLASVLIVVRGRLGEEPAQLARRNLTLISATLSGMPILVPLSIELLAIDLAGSAYRAASAMCVAATIASALHRAADLSREAPPSDSPRRSPKLPIIGLVCSNTCVLVAVLTLPIVTAADATMSMRQALTLGLAAWLLTNLALVLFQSKVSLDTQLAVGMAALLLAFGLSLGALATGVVGLYFLAQVPVYVAAIVLQATLFARIAGDRKNSTRRFGIQSGVQVAILTFVVAVASRVARPVETALSGQLTLIFITLICCAILVFRANPMNNIGRTST